MQVAQLRQPEEARYYPQVHQCYRHIQHQEAERAPYGDAVDTARPQARRYQPQRLLVFVRLATQDGDTEEE